MYITTGVGSTVILVDEKGKNKTSEEGKGEKEDTPPLPPPPPLPPRHCKLKYRAMAFQISAHITRSSGSQFYRSVEMWRVFLASTEKI
jgi:hypothetical protein